MTTNQKPEILLLVDSAAGIYVPRQFSRQINRSFVSKVSPEDWAILEAGPDHSEYWDAWCDVCDCAEITAKDGQKYTLWQDGDLWAVPVGMEWNDDRGCWEWPFDGESFVGPSCWASYLINGDASGISDEEKAQADKASEGLGHCVDAIEQGFVSRPDYGLAGDCCEYRFLPNANSKAQQ